MTDEILIGKNQSIRECGLDEYWLQNQIVDNPDCLQLGELEVISRERQQASGGRLDILLKDPEDGTMYEVEVMLGETDETHIIRTIEYWDNERRKWPQREHFAVIIAETITRRFFNVIQLLSHAIPIIAIQVNIVEADGKKILHFSKILDTYEEPEDEGTAIGREYNEEFWVEKSSTTLGAANALLAIFHQVEPTAVLRFGKNYIRIEVRSNNYMSLRKRSGVRFRLSCWLSETYLEQAMALLEDAGMACSKKNDRLRITTDIQTITEKADTFAKFFDFLKKSWDE